MSRSFALDFDVSIVCMTQSGIHLDVGRARATVEPNLKCAILLPLSAACLLALTIDAHLDTSKIDDLANLGVGDNHGEELAHGKRPDPDNERSGRRCQRRG